MNINIFTNSQKQIGPLVEELTAKADDIFIASAYISRKAVDTLVQRANLSRRPNLKKVDILFGIFLEMDNTALDALLEASQQHPECFNIRYAKSNSGRLFHPKVYYFQCGQICHIIIASANLTHQGHYQNEEIYCHIECLSSDKLPEQLNAIRHAWLKDPFSAHLDEKLVELFRTLASADAAKKAIIDIVKSTSGSVMIPLPLMPAKELWLNELNKGYLISTDFSIAALSVPVPILSIPVPIREPEREDGLNGDTVVIRANMTASVQLLPGPIRNEFVHLHRDAKRMVAQHSIIVPPGLYYIPPSAQKSFAANMRSLLIEHKQKIYKYIRLKSTMTQHLRERLEAECKVEWQKHKNQQGIVPELEFYQNAKDRIKDRREAFSHDPHSAVRLSINPYPHPLINRSQNPSHAAWDLCDASLDDGLLKTVLAILVAQTELIIEAAKKKQQPSVQEDYNRAKLLTSIHGKTIDDLLTKLCRLAGRNWGNVSKRRKPTAKLLTPGMLMTIELEKLWKKAEKHKAWLESMKHKKPQEALDLLLQEYSC